MKFWVTRTNKNIAAHELRPEIRFVHEMRPENI